MTIAELLLPELDEEIRISRAYLERVPEDRMDWTPHEKSMNLSRLATHVAEIPGWAESILVRDELDFASEEMQAWEPRELQTVAEILEELDRTASRCREIVEATDDEAFQAPWTMRQAEQVLMTAPKYAVFRRQLLNHMVHHRGQLGVYLRQLEVPLPMAYGPTADETGGMG